MTEGNLTISQLKEKPSGFVGVAGGVRGLIRIGKEGLISRKYQYSTSNMTHSRNWVPLEMFTGVVKWLVDGKISDIDWSGKFPSEMIYQIAENFSIFVGIRGGESALKSLTTDVIQGKEWAPLQG